MVEKVPVMPSLYEKGADGGALLGSKCKSCGNIFFPPTPLCYECLNDETETVTLSRIGKLYSYTISHMPSTHFKAPYALAWIELPEGIRLASSLKDWEEKDLKIGMEMELVIEKLWDEDDKEIIGHKFRPVS